jgi:hypothetical protein
MSFILRIAHLLLKVRNFFTRPVTLGVRLLPIRGLPGNLSSGSGRRIQEYKEGKIYCWGDW